MSPHQTGKNIIHFAKTQQQLSTTWNGSQEN